MMLRDNATLFFITRPWRLSNDDQSPFDKGASRLALTFVNMPVKGRKACLFYIIAEKLTVSHCIACPYNP